MADEVPDSRDADATVRNEIQALSRSAAASFFATEAAAERPSVDMEATTRLLRNLLAQEDNFVERYGERIDVSVERETAVLLRALLTALPALLRAQEEDADAERFIRAALDGTLDPLMYDAIAAWLRKRAARSGGTDYGR